MTGARHDARAAAARLIAAVVHDGRSLSQLGPQSLATLADERDRAFVQACAYGVLRSLFSLRARLTELMPKPLRGKDSDIEALLLAGLYQLCAMRLPSHAAVSATVAAARTLGKPWACGLINGVLRQALRTSADSRRPADECVEFEHPAWLIHRVRQDWPLHWRDMLSAANRQAPLTLRVNQQRCAPRAYLAALHAAGHNATLTAHSECGIRLDTPAPVTSLPHFADGWLSVQDEAAQLAATLLAPPAHARVLDACAAPGGKTAHLLERYPDLDLLALDRDAERLSRLRENLLRLGLDCRIRSGDAAEPASWWDGRFYDRILLDAPCSALGVVRRHPDIRLRRHAADLPLAAVAQIRLLTALWPLLAPGGRLLYCVCSIMPEETDGAIAALLDACPDARSETLSAAWGIATRHGRQILPGDDQMDGFYYAVLSKPEAGA